MRGIKRTDISIYVRLHFTKQPLRQRIKITQRHNGFLSVVGYIPLPGETQDDFEDTVSDWLFEQVKVSDAVGLRSAREKNDD